MTDEVRKALSKHVSECILGDKESWTRRMFELATRMRVDGGGPVWDLSLGNPSLEPPDRWRRAIVELLDDEPPGMHRYMTNAGYPDVRAFIAEREATRYGLSDLRGEDVTMTVGAAGAVNVMFRSVLDPGDAVVVPAPYFSEYGHYCANVGAELWPVRTTADFALDLEAMDEAFETLGDRARVLLLNSPNNPTGAIYSAAALDRLCALLERRFAGRERPLWVIEDCPYRDVVHDPSTVVASMIERWANTVLLTSHSKDLGLAGERIGYLVISPRARGRALLRRATGFCNRTLGFVNAPALMQRVLPRVLSHPEGRVRVEVYAANCRRMAAALTSLGFVLPPVRAGFFLFPRVPERLRGSGEVSSDIALTERLRIEQRTIVVPGTTFGVSDHLRLAMCVDEATVEGAINAFRAVCAES